MLLCRGISILIILQISICMVLSQNYDAEYNAEHDSDDHSSYSDDHGYDHPDYSKYYSVDSSAPIVQSPIAAQQSGFIPNDFASFFGQSTFDFGSASNTKEIAKPSAQPIQAFGFVSNSFKPTEASPIPNHDFFEESQQVKSANQENPGSDFYESRPGPNYISHKISPKEKYTAESNVAEKVEKDKEELEEYDYENDKDNIRDIDELYNDKYSNNKNNLEAATTEKYSGEINGKSSYGDTKNQYSPQYYNRLTATPTLTPYQKFSFQQPTEDYGYKPLTSESQAVPFNPNYKKYSPVVTQNYEFPDASATVATQVSAGNRNCKKINKDVPSVNGKAAADVMDCYVCEDPKTGLSYEQCSYSSEPTPKSYYFTNSKTFNPLPKSQSYRYKRYTSKENINEYSDPYEYVKSNSKYTPEAAASEEYNVDNDEYRFGPEYFSEGGGDTDRNYSEQESEKLAKSGEHCEKTKKDGMTCMVCKNEKTGGKYEQCNYATEPQEQKFAYVKEKKFNSKDDPSEENAEGSEEQPVKKQRLRDNPKKYYGHSKGEKGRKSDDIVEYVDPVDTRRQLGGEKYEEDDKNAKQQAEDDEESYEVPQHFQDSTNDNPDIVGLDPEHYGSADDNGEYNNEESEAEEEEDEEKPDKKKANSKYTLGEYHFKFFPEFSNEESTNKENKVQSPEQDIHETFQADQTKDVEEVLAEFVKKDRSKCTKAEKRGMTCYLCVDANGLENEECMYVSESRPKATHIAYHGATELKDKKDRKPLNIQPEESKDVLKTVKTETPIIDFAAVESKLVDVTTPTSVKTSKRKFARDRNIPKITTGDVVSSTDTRIKRNTKYSKKTRESREKKPERVREEEELEDEPELKTPNEYENLEGADGAYSAETRPVYSKVLGATLPKYMLDRSIAEKEFDDFVAGG